ncbi:GntR family transcriptional regulator [Poseidonocella sp. HB161398]|uniref:GntR family transcriptional regulator n=1 Tax=Poseidonocella sp. HB161398 TaxID=2320855 RepID=UPI001107C9FF|nr:GntR family transcriptional regulator [Poseidonocella sp. HB161398]
MRQSLHAELTQTVRQKILDGELKPGEKIRELQLCEELEVSRTPMREVLKALSAEGLVTLLHNRGAIVSIVSAEQIQELFPIIAVLEELAGQIAAGTLSDAQMEELEALHCEIEAGFEAGDEGRYRNANRTFHEKLVEWTGNGSLLELYKLVLTRMHMGRFLLQKTEADWATAMQDHRDIMEALRARDGARTGRILRFHAEKTARNASLNALTRAAAREGGEAAPEPR